jgi:DNA (cytosine-5)-methyltransferase 1
MEDGIQQMRRMQTIGSLCTGYGGLDLAAEAYFNAQTIWAAEYDKYASQVVEARFGVPNYGNIKEIDWASLPKVDILTAGYPCQPFSHAGQRKGVQDERHIWPEIVKGIGILRPKFVILENVRGHLSLGFKEVLKDLAEIGFDAEWQIVRASDVGAPHHRARLFIIAYPIGERCEDQLCGEKSNKSIESVVGNTSAEYKPYNRQMQELGRRFATRSEMCLQEPPNGLVDGKVNPLFVEYMMGLPKGWITDLDLSRTQMMKMLGNGVVPQQAYYALEILTQHAV